MTHCRKCDSIYIERCIQDILARKVKKEYLISTLAVPPKKNPHQMSKIQAVVFPFGFIFYRYVAFFIFCSVMLQTLTHVALLWKCFFQSAEGSTLLSARACKPALASVRQASTQTEADPP